jgi:2-C-methyl-D-erythritol 4-phosphate cytidylyltransferase
MLGLIILAIEEENGGAAFIPSEDLLGVRILARSIAGALPTKESISGVLVVPEAIVNSVREDVVQEFGLDEIDRVVRGGQDRWSSLQAGLEALPADLDWVVIQDGNRPLVPMGLLDRVLEAAKQGDAAAPAVLVKEPLGQLNPDGNLLGAENREQLRSLQGPQVYRRSALEDIVSQQKNEGGQNTDVAMYAVTKGVQVALVEGDEDNLVIRDQRDIGRSLEAFSRRAVEYAFLYPRGMLPDDPLKDALAPGEGNLDGDMFEDDLMLDSAEASKA